VYYLLYRVKYSSPIHPSRDHEKDARNVKSNSEHASMLMGILSRLAAVDNDEEIWERCWKYFPTRLQPKQNTGRDESEA
jgi:hypothetical protein